MKKKPQRSGWAWEPVKESLTVRVRAAVDEGRYQQALELAKNLHKSEPTPANRALLHEVSLGRARQLALQGHEHDAASTLNADVATPGFLAEWTAQVALDLARYGDAPGAMKLVDLGGDAALREQVVAHLVDAALSQEKNGRQLVPREFQAEFERILLAFNQQEKGHDESARETLQGIGLRSPFMEWKVLLRGLQAYYQKDEVRALENWQRLKTDRLPYRLIAPLRFALDQEFQVRQPPATQTILQKQLARLQAGSLLAGKLRELQGAISGQGSLAQAFRLAESILPQLRTEAPHLVPRLAKVLYGVLITGGEPEDVPRYRRVFGNPPDDPHFNRLHATGWERAGAFDESHRSWQNYEKDISALPQIYPGEQGKLARALVWKHMGDNAARIPTAEQMRALPEFLRERGKLPKPLKPNAEECYRKSLELAPDQLRTHQAVFQHLVACKLDAKALKAGAELLQRFPDDVPTLQEMGHLLQKSGKYSEALLQFQRALQHNPLDRKLRRQVAEAHLLTARDHTEKRRFDAARAEFQAALKISEASDNSPIYCKWAACEFKAGDPSRAEELLHEALAEADNRLAVAYSMLIEVIRIKLPATLKKRFDREFTDGLAASPTPLAVTALASTTAIHVRSAVDYVGQKSHQKKVLAYVKKAAQVGFTEEQLERLCNALSVLSAPRLFDSFVELGKRRFPASPAFWLLESEAMLTRGPGGFSPFALSLVLGEAEKRLRALPPDPKTQELLDIVHQRHQLVEMLNPFSRLFDNGPLDPFGGFDEDDDFA